MTVLVHGNDWDELWVDSQAEPSGVTAQRRNGYPFGSNSFVVGVPVWEGTCTLKVQGRKAGEASAVVLVRVFHPSGTTEGVQLSVTPTILHAPATTVQIEPTYSGIGTPQEAWFDPDGDGRLDAAASPVGGFSWSYPGQGYFLPGWVVRAANGIYYDSTGLCNPGHR